MLAADKVVWCGAVHVQAECMTSLTKRSAINGDVRRLGCGLDSESAATRHATNLKDAEFMQ